jgi:transcriptional regulator with XRE-family HTH domain
MSDALPLRQLRTLADKLNHLFATVRPPGHDREYTNAEVAQATGVSGSYVGYLRKGIRDNPTVDAVQSLARHFGVRPSYFVDEDLDEERLASVDAQLRLARALITPGIEALAMRAAEADLSPEALDALTAMIEQVQRLEHAAGSKKRRHKTRP